MGHALSLFIDKQPIRGLEQMLHAVDVCLRLDQTALPRPLSVPPILGDLPPPQHQPTPLGLLSMLKSMVGVETIEEDMVVEKIYHIGKEPLSCDCAVFVLCQHLYWLKTLAPKAKLSKQCTWGNNIEIDIMHYI